jgi:hypothetical protein
MKPENDKAVPPPFERGVGRLVENREGLSMQDTNAELHEKPMLAWSSQAVLDVAAERRRQIEVEGWTPEHDDEHRTGGMAVAAACYAAWSLPSRPASEAVATLWPWTGWAQKWFKPKDTRHNLIRAAALLVAEIERLDRHEPPNVRAKPEPTA